MIFLYKQIINQHLNDIFTVEVDQILNSMSFKYYCIFQIYLIRIIK